MVRLRVLPGQCQPISPFDSRSAIRRGRDAAFVNTVACPGRTFDPQDRKRIRRLVAPDDRVDVLVASPQQLLFFPFQRTASFFRCKSARVDWPGRRRCNRLRTVANSSAVWLKRLFDACELASSAASGGQCWAKRARRRAANDSFISPSSFSAAPYRSASACSVIRHPADSCE